MSSFLKTVAVVIASALIAVPVNAVEYTTRASVNQRVSYDDNILLFPDLGARDPRQSLDRYAWIYELAPEFRLGARGQRWQGNINTRLSFTRLSNTGLDSDDQYLDANWERSGERMRWGVEASVDRTSTRSLIAELDDLVVNASRVETRSLRPDWTLVLSEKDELRVGANWLETKYQEPRFTDYENYGLELGWRRRLNENDDLSVTVYRTDFDSGRVPSSLASTDIKSESETVGLQVGFNRRFNEALSASLSLGARSVDSTSRRVECVEFLFIFCLEEDIVTRNADSSGFTAQAGMVYSSEFWSLSASLARSLRPNGFVGGLLETDTLALRYVRRLRANVTFELVANGSQAESVSDAQALGAQRYARDHYTIEPRLRWRFSERWTFVGGLRHRIRDVDSSFRVIDSDGSAAIIQVLYQHPQNRFSR